MLGFLPHLALRMGGFLAAQKGTVLKCVVLRLFTYMSCRSNEKNPTCGYRRRAFGFRISHVDLGKTLRVAFAVSGSNLSPPMSPPCVTYLAVRSHLRILVYLNLQKLQFIIGAQ